MVFMLHLRKHPRCDFAMFTQHADALVDGLLVSLLSVVGDVNASSGSPVPVADDAGMAEAEAVAAAALALNKVLFL